MARFDDRSESNIFQRSLRGADFWRRAVGIYAGFKVAQVRGAALRATGCSDADAERKLWGPHHKWAGREMYNLCVDLRGFYLKAGQFIGARGDFVPEAICLQLSKLHDQVPPMPAKRAEAVLKREFGISDLGEVFEDIDLDDPLGSASIAQVHKARLRSPVSGEAKSLKNFKGKDHKDYCIQEGEQAWDVCNRHGICLDQLRSVNKGVDLNRLTIGQVIRLPIAETFRGGDEKADASWASRAAARAMSSKDRPKDGAVAVKVQYPDALKIMKQDLRNVRSWAAFLSKTEIKFDMVSAVDELERQIELEFDFTREARVMDSIANSLQNISDRVSVPRSIPGLVTPRVLVMRFMEGVPLRELGSRTQKLSARKKRIAKERVLSRISEAYGRMILGDGLFQADGHPGNILVQEGAKIALLDYGQSKHLNEADRMSLAKLIVALNGTDREAISKALDALGIVTETDNTDVRRKMAIGMFDTKGHVDPFDKNSPIKQSAISKFPPDFFLVLRVVQLIRGLKEGMGVDEFSSAKQWKPYAERTLRDLGS
ncbi:hypothetical protein BSKO_04796 [Bryopsis sp. KO-2023]|nr:hypothetical protein BSKO_04796 [Bryopsis sp. KO-2023]